MQAGSGEVGHAVGRVNRQIKGYKSIEFLLVAFKQALLLERLILRLVEFIWKYENAKEIVFSFGFSTAEKESFIRELRDRLSTYCSVIEKKKGRERTEARFVFVKKGISQKNVHNPHPEEFHFKLYSVLTTEKIKLEQHRGNPQPHLHY